MIPSELAAVLFVAGLALGALFASDALCIAWVFSRRSDDSGGE